MKPRISLKQAFALSLFANVMLAGSLCFAPFRRPTINIYSSDFKDGASLRVSEATIVAVKPGQSASVTVDEKSWDCVYIVGAKDRPMYYEVRADEGNLYVTDPGPTVRGILRDKIPNLGL